IDEAQVTRDGRRIVFQMRTTDWPNRGRIPQIWQINADGTGLRRMKTSEAGGGFPRWSPDGSAIAYVSQGQVSIVSADGGGQRQISKRGTAASDIAWHPDGTSIYFLAQDPLTDAQRDRVRLRGDVRVLDEYGQRHLWKINVRAGKETRIT